MGLLSRCHHRRRVLRLCRLPLPRNPLLARPHLPLDPLTRTHIRADAMGLPGQYDTRPPSARNGLPAIRPDAQIPLRRVPLLVLHVELDVHQCHARHQLGNYIHQVLPLEAGTDWSLSGR